MAGKTGWARPVTINIELDRLKVDTFSGNNLFYAAAQAGFDEVLLSEVRGPSTGTKEIAEKIFLKVVANIQREIEVAQRKILKGDRSYFEYLSKSTISAMRVWGRESAAFALAIQKEVKSLLERDGYTCELKKCDSQMLLQKHARLGPRHAQRLTGTKIIGDSKYMDLIISDFVPLESDITIKSSGQ